ncbi:hypothetical protein AC578_8724 [Pseudocercospora eumusae]|uniref:Uncharacterized protein n=1 Tax=Pseudocercospora eumusae TaxID=321146 RepID=A0A139HPY7_9PEZI|nr:hypothetical protein AC578_8724 [Pseudocercospora eumusae]
MQAPDASDIAELASSAAPDRKVQIAKHLKNVLVGHDQRKELAVKLGIIQPLADIITSATKATGKQRRQESNGVALHQPSGWTIDDELRLQAILIIGSLASGGQAFLQPLCAADIPRVLVDALSTDIAPRLATAVLQGLKALASFWAAADEPPVDYDLWFAIFNTESLNVFDHILRQPTNTAPSKQQLRLVCEIISALPDVYNVPTTTKVLITNCGILDTLACLMVSHAIENKIVEYRGDISQLPHPPPDACLPSLLAAVATVIAGSNYRAHRFILEPHIRDLFLHSGADSADHRALFGARHGFANPHHSLLPPLHIPAYRTVSHNPSSNSFPALKSLQSGKQTNGAQDYTPLVGDIDHSNAVCGWLIVLTRSMQGLNRLIAMRLLALVSNAIDADPAGPSHRTEFIQKTRERHRQLSLLAVPLAVKLVQAASEGRNSESVTEQRELHGIQEHACSVLALLIGGNKDLQVAAVDAHAIKYVCPFLKKSFDNVTLAKPMWSAKPDVQVDMHAPPSCHLGAAVFPPEITHSMRCRRGALKALEALAAKEDVHRRAIIDAGVVSCIIDSLKPFPSDLTETSNARISITPKDGNTTPVILAACRAAQSMSRSVSVLRTSLIDGGIAKPLIQLLHHKSLDVQIAATDVCCNLLPDFSPMRDDLSDGKVVSILVEHARSNSAALRLASLWALKHLVFGCPKELKLKTLEELGTGWLVGIIQGEHRETTSAAGGGGVSVGLSTPNAAGEQVDILNPSTMDVDEQPAYPSEAMDEDDEDGEVLYDEASSTHYQSSSLRSTLACGSPAFNRQRYLASIREMEQNDEYTARRDEIAIQGQALDFVRNLINGDDCAALSDHLMLQIGSSKVYDLLREKLSPISRAMSNGRAVYNPTELVLSTIHVVIHLANASPKHRQMLIAQKPLLQAMLPHFNHLDHRVRVMCVWAVNSLTWIEEDGDRKDARQRSSELRNLGIEQAVKGLANDPNLDVRERVKTAMRQFETL